MGDRRTRAVYRLLLRLLPRAVREADGPALEEAALACLARERHRGVVGAASAWIGLLTDLVATAVAARRSAPPLVALVMIDERPNRQRTLEGLMDAFQKDLRYAIRSLLRQPGFTVVTVLTLALGIGANTAVFSVVHGVLLRPLPYPQPERLEFITSQFPSLGFEQFWVSLPEFVEFRDHNRAYESVGAYAVGAVNLESDPPSRPVAGTVTPELLPTLGVQPMLGRLFTPQDSEPGASPVAILSWELWQRAFGADPSVIGRRVQINNQSEEIVGIMPRGFDVHDSRIEIWRPQILNPAVFPNTRGNHGWYLVGRRKPEVTAAMAKQEVARLVDEWASIGQGHFPTPRNKDGGGHPLRVDPLHEDIVGDIRQALVVLQAAVGFVLLIACANLANLLIARADTRIREYAVRAALGASRWRLFRQLLTEGLVLTVAASTVGVGLAYAGLQALLAVNPDAIPRSSEVTVDGTVLLFTLLVAAFTGLVFAFVPLLHLGSGTASQVVRDTGSRATAGKARIWARSGLVVAEVALAVLLVVGAGLLVRSFMNLMRVDLGFNRSGLSTFSVVLPGQRYNGQQRVDFYARLSEQLRAVPGVQSVTAMSGLPPLRNVNANDTDFEHIPNMRPAGSLPNENVDYWQYVSVGYAETMGIPIIEGRAFEDADRGGAPVAMVNEALVRKFFTDRSPIGAQVRPGFNPQVPFLTIVGVVKDVKQGGLAEEVGTELYMLTDQVPRNAGGFAPAQMNFVVRSPRDVELLAPDYRRIVRALDPALPVIGLRSMEVVIGDAVAQPRFLTMLLTSFAVLALVLAAVGTYGVLSYLVAERRQEIGIRMALGADRGGILRLVLVRGLLLSLAGVTVGLAGAVGLSRVLSSLLYNVTPTDPLTLSVVAGIMLIVACVACFVPAFRATRVDPLKVLRDA